MKRLYVLASVVLLGACGGGDGPAAPAPGAIAVSSSVSTTLDNASFDYTIVVDQGAPRTIPASAPASFVVPGLSAGAHTVTVSGLAAGCTTGGGDTRSVTVVSGDTVPVNFSVTCARTTGDITVQATTTGPDQDVDGYTVTVDGAGRGTVTSNGSLPVRVLAPGAHVVELTGLAPNCSTTPALRSANVTAGGVALVTFPVVCRARTGVIRFNATTTGQDITTVGYGAFIGTERFVEVPANGTARVLDVPVGPVRVVVLGEQSNCAVTMPPVRTVNVTANDTVVVSITGACLGRNSTGQSMFAVTDPANDTLPITRAGRPRAFDILAFNGQYHQEGWMTMAVRVDRPATGFIFEEINSMLTRLDLDLDENPATGAQPFVRNLGSTVTQGVDAVVFVDLDTTTAQLGVGNQLVGLAAAQFVGDIVYVRFPLSLLADDGNMSITAAVGRLDGLATDYVPNESVVVARRPGTSFADAVSRIARALPAGQSLPSADEARAALRAARERQQAMKRQGAPGRMP